MHAFRTHSDDSTDGDCWLRCCNQHSGTSPEVLAGTHLAPLSRNPIAALERAVAVVPVDTKPAAFARGLLRRGDSSHLGRNLCARAICILYTADVTRVRNKQESVNNQITSCSFICKVYILYTFICVGGTLIR